MKTSRLRQIVASTLTLLVLAAGAQFTDAAAFDYYYDDLSRFALYGQQDNFTG